MTAPVRDRCGPADRLQIVATASCAGCSFLWTPLSSPSPPCAPTEPASTKHEHAPHHIPMQFRAHRVGTRPQVRVWLSQMRSHERFRPHASRRAARLAQTWYVAASVQASGTENLNRPQTEGERVSTVDESGRRSRFEYRMLGTATAAPRCPDLLYPMGLRY